MSWNLITLESPSFNNVNAGTQLRLPCETWAEQNTDPENELFHLGNGTSPKKVARGARVQQFSIKGQFTDKFAKDTTIWSTTIINGVSRSSLNNWQEFRDLLRSSESSWWSEAVAGNWHDDGNPARQRGQSRLRLERDGNLNPQYHYGVVMSTQFLGVKGGADAGLVDYELIFLRATPHVVA